MDQDFRTAREQEVFTSYNPQSGNAPTLMDYQEETEITVLAPLRLYVELGTYVLENDTVDNAKYRDLVNGMRAILLNANNQDAKFYKHARISTATKTGA